MSWLDELSSGTAGPDDNTLSHIAHAVFSPLMWLGETLDKPGRAVRGLLGGDSSALLNLIPFSDTMGITDPSKSVSGQDLLRKADIIDGEDSWGNFLAGLGTEIVTDPLNLLTFGTKASLTAAGKVAQKAGTLEKTAVGRIGSGQAGTWGLRTPWWLPGEAQSVAFGTGKGGEAVANAMSQLGERVTDIPGVSKLRSLLEYGTGFTGHNAYVKGASGVAPEAEQRVLGQLGEQLTPFGRTQSEAFQTMRGAGVAPAEMEDAWSRLSNQYGENALTGQSSPLLTAPAPIAAQGPQAVSDWRAGLMGMNDAGEATGRIQALAQRGATQRVEDLARETGQGMGILTGESDQYWPGMEYTHQRSASAGRQLRSQQTGRTVPRTVFPGGTNEINDLVNMLDQSGNPVYAGIARAKQAGAPLDQAAIEAAIQRNADAIAGRATAVRDSLVPPTPAGPGVRPTPNAALGQDEREFFKELDSARVERPRARAYRMKYQPGGGIPAAAELTPEQAEIMRKLGDDTLKTDARKAAEWLANLDPEVAKEGRGFYRPDPFGNQLEYVSNVAKQAGRAEGALNTLTREAVPAAEAFGQATDAGQFKTLDQVLTDAKLNAARESATNPNAYEAGGRLNLMNRLIEEGKLPQSLAGTTDKSAVEGALKQLAIPSDLSDVIRREVAGPPARNRFGLGENIDRYLQAFRSAVTVPFPAYHLRNANEGLIQQLLGGGFGLEHLADTRSYLNGSITDAAKAAEMSGYAGEMIAHNAGLRGQAMELIGRDVSGSARRAVEPLVEQGAGSAGGVVGDWLNRFRPSQAAEGERYLTMDPRNNTLIQRGVETHQAIDDTMRMSQFTGLRRQGYAPAAAAEIVRNSQLDYSRLTPGEQYLRQVIPFYAFSKANIGRTARQLEDPGALASLVRGATEGRQDDSIPAYVTPGAALPIGQGDQPGTKRFLSGFGLPIEDEMLGAALSAASLRPMEAARRAASALDPLTKLVMESATGTQLYSGRKFDELRPGNVASLGGLLPNNLAMTMTELASATPLARILNTVDKGSAVASGSQGLDAVMQLLTGVKTTDVNTSESRNAAARQVLTDLLKSSGKVGTRQDVYIRPDFKGQDPDLEKLMGYLRSVEQQGRAQRKVQALSR